jgi:hypothetical protein
MVKNHINIECGIFYKSYHSQISPSEAMAISQNQQISDYKDKF